ncbi:3-dehydroquinate synthase [mine drainage metagenome]|uniref:3-dehydroquinate synthase n=1 Tax=mine drainage metagenome TaxID=410659 RepID=T0Z5K1_9ZZZZ
MYLEILMKDSGEREFLNFGHTVGHAIERASGYRIPHGTAVMRGMQIESKVLSKILGKEDAVSGLVADVSRRFSIPEIQIEEEMHQSLIDAIRFDKKIRSGKISVQAVDKPGSCRNVSLPLEKYLEVLDTWLKEN